MGSALSVESCAILGMLDEFYNAFTQIRDANFQQMELQSEGGKQIPSSKDLREATYSLTKKTINKLVDDHLFCFTNLYHKIIIGNTVLKRYSFFYFELTKKPGELRYRHVSFKTFIDHVGDMIIDTLIYLRKRDNPKVLETQVCKEFNDRITRMCASEGALRSVRRDEVCVDGIIVFENLSSISCNRNKHSVSSDRFAAPILGTDQSVMLPIHNCSTCNRRFIGRRTLELYCSKYGKVYINKISEDADGTILYSGFGESPLHRAGYNVRDGEYTQKERQDLLKLFVDNGIFSPFEIIRDLDNSIRIFENNHPRFIDAVYKWRNDMKFIAEYSSGII